LFLAVLFFLVSVTAAFSLPLFSDVMLQGGFVGEAVPSSSLCRVSETGRDGTE
jgi:hypothetical protein